MKRIFKNDANGVKSLVSEYSRVSKYLQIRFIFHGKFNSTDSLLSSVKCQMNTKIFISTCERQIEEERKKKTEKEDETILLSQRHLLSTRARVYVCTYNL